MSSETTVAVPGLPVSATKVDITYFKAMYALQIDAPVFDQLRSDQTVGEYLKSAQVYLDSNPLKDIGQELGEIIGRVLGGVVKGAIDAIAETIQQLVHNIVTEARQFVAEVTERVKAAADHIIEKVDEVIQAALRAIQRTLMLLKRMITSIIELTHRRLLEAIFEAGIAAYTIMYSLPFRSKPSRLVYAGPFGFRPNYYPDEVITVHGNFLRRVDEWYVDDVEVVPVRMTDEQVDIRLPSDKIAYYGKKDVKVTIKARKSTGLFGLGAGEDVGSLGFYVGTAIDYSVAVTVTPSVLITTRSSHRHRFDHRSPGGGAYSVPEQTYKEVYGPSNLRARIVTFNMVDVEQNGAKWNNYLDTAGNLVVAQATLEGRGWFGPGRWAAATFDVIEEVPVAAVGESHSSTLDLKESDQVMEANSTPHPNLDALVKRQGADSKTLRWDVKLLVSRKGEDGSSVVVPIAVERVRSGEEQILDSDAALTVAEDGSVYLRVERRT